MYKDFVKFERNLYKSEEFFLLQEPHFSGNEKRHLTECFDNTFVSSVRKYVYQIEKGMCKFTVAKYALACVNGTAALLIALLLSDVKSDDKVITQSLTFIATAGTYAGAKPVFIDEDNDIIVLSLEKLEQLLDFLKKKRAVAKQYDRFFINYDFEFFKESEFVESNYWLNAVKIKRS